MSEPEIVPEEENEAGDVSLKKLREKLKKAVAEKQEYLEGWQRAKADLINFKREVEEAKKAVAEFANEDLIMQLLPVLDSFKMAFSADSWKEGDPEWQKGIEHIHSQFKSILEANGIKEINPEGEKFDPARHNSIETILVDNKNKDGVIVEVVQSGYTLNDKIIRPASVKVGEFKK